MGQQHQYLYGRGYESACLQRSPAARRQKPFEVWARVFRSPLLSCSKARRQPCQDCLEDAQTGCWALLCIEARDSASTVPPGKADCPGHAVLPDPGLPSRENASASYALRTLGADAGEPQGGCECSCPVLMCSSGNPSSLARRTPRHLAVRRRMMSRVLSMNVCKHNDLHARWKR
jgi:hypothetical protein